MRLRMTMLTLVFSLGLSANIRADQPTAVGKTDKTDPAHIQKLIDDLGSASFSERNQASKDLEAIGPTALVQLRKGIKSSDQELVSRVNRLVDRLEEKALTNSFLTPKRVHLKVNDVTVLEAVAELQKLSGQQLDVTGNRAGLAARKITLDTGDVTLWEALQQLCDKGGMIEQVTVNRQFQQPNMPVYRVPQPQPQTQNRSIVLVEAAPNQKLPPTCFLGSVPRPRPAGKPGRAGLSR